MTNEIETAIDAIPGEEGWLNTEARRRFMILAQLLMDTGTPRDMTVNMCQKAYDAAVDEFTTEISDATP